MFNAVQCSGVPGAPCIRARVVRRLPGEVTLPQELPDGGDKVGLWRGRLLVLCSRKFSGPCLEFEHS